MATSMSSSMSTSSTTPATFTDPSIERVRAEQTAARAGLTSLLEDARTLYQDLINQGRTADAYSLRDATERMTRIGSKLGVSAWSRTQALQDVAARMRDAAALSEDKVIAQRLGQHQQVLSELRNADNTAFDQAMQIAQAKTQENKFVTQQSFAEKRYADQQKQQALQNSWTEADRKKALAAAAPKQSFVGNAKPLASTPADTGAWGSGVFRRTSTNIAGDTVVPKWYNK